MLSKTPLLFTTLAIFLIFAVSCKKDGETGIQPVFSFDFTKSEEGFTGGFSDHHDTSTADYNLVYARTPLPAPLNTTRQSLKLGGTNRSDDLFMFLKKKITGLEPNTSYKLNFQVEFASNAPTGGLGVGGSPDAVMMKAGAVLFEPRSSLAAGQDTYRMNLDHGQQETDGKDLYNLGKIGVGPNTTQYTLISRNNNARPFPIKTDSKGEVWICIGTDSGFEARTELYYNKITVTFNK